MGTDEETGNAIAFATFIQSRCKIIWLANMQKYRVKIPFCCRKCVLSVSRRQHWTGAPTGLSNDRNHHNHQAAPLICTWRPGRGWRRLWCSNMMTVTSKRPTPARQPGPGAALPWLSAVHLTFISFKCSQWTIKIMRPSPLNIQLNSTKIFTPNGKFIIHTPNYIQILEFWSGHHHMNKTRKNAIFSMQRMMQNFIL